MMAELALAAMTLGELLGSGAGASGQLSVSDLVLDSREARPGAAFLAVPGATHHGLEFAPQALAAGAEIVLYEPDARHAAPSTRALAVPGLSNRLGELAQRFFARGAFPLEMLGVTGTNGKTSVAYLAAQALPIRCGYVGTLGYGVPPTLTRHQLTTPDCMTLHRELASLATTHAAIEVSSHALVQNRIDGLEIHTALITNLSRDHLDQHGSLEAYGAAKASLFTRPGVEHAVLNLDDAFAASLARKLPSGCEVVGVSLEDSAADIHARCEDRGLDGLGLEVGGRFGNATIESRLIGRFNAENLLLALGALAAWQVPLEQAARGLGAAEAPPGRMRVLGGGDAPTVVIDYAHTPAALERVLATLEARTAGALWCVFGCGGERDRGKRALMGQAAERHASRIVVTDDNPRNEDPAAIVADILTGIEDRSRVEIEHSRAAAIERAIERAAPGDVVLVAGKGHEDYQLLTGRSVPFDDAAAAADALGRRT